jgi:hypothetical protein
MSKGPQKKIRLTVNIDETLWIKTLELHISPVAVAQRAIKAEVSRASEAKRKKERKVQLKAVQALDPRIKDAELKSPAKRVRRLRRMASVYEPSVGI